MGKEVDNYMDLVNDDSLSAFCDFLKLNTKPASGSAIWEPDLYKSWQLYCNNMELPYGVYKVMHKLLKDLGAQKHVGNIVLLRGITWKEDAEYRFPGAKNYRDPLSPVPEQPRKLILRRA